MTRSTGLAMPGAGPGQDWYATAAWMALIVLFGLSALVPVAHSSGTCACRVRLDVDPTYSIVKLSTSNRLNTITSGIDWQRVDRGLQGTVFACSAEPCPALQDLQLLQFSFATGSNRSLVMYPDLHLGKTILGRSLNVWVGDINLQPQVTPCNFRPGTFITVAFPEQVMTACVD